MTDVGDVLLDFSSILLSSMSVLCPYHTVLITVTLGRVWNQEVRPSTLFLLKSSLSLTPPFLLLCFSPLNFCMNFSVYSAQEKLTVCFGKNFIDSAALSKGNMIISSLKSSNPWKKPVFLISFLFFPSFWNFKYAIYYYYWWYGQVWVCVLWCACGSQLYKVGSLLAPFCELWEWHVGLQACLASTYTHWVTSTSQALKTSYLHM